MKSKGQEERCCTGRSLYHVAVDEFAKREKFFPIILSVIHDRTQYLTNSSMNSLSDSVGSWVVGSTKLQFDTKRLENALADICSKSWISVTDDGITKTMLTIHILNVQVSCTLRVDGGLGDDKMG